MKYNGTEKTLITIHSPEDGDIRMPNWGADFTIVHYRYIVGIGKSEIFTMDSVGGNITRLTYNDASDDYPKISENSIAFTSKPRNDKLFHIWTINTDGSGLKQLTQGYTCDWSPDGKQIVYTDSRAENGRLWIMDVDGSNKKQLTFEYYFNF